MASSLDIVGINKRFGKGDKSVEVLRKIDIHVAPGEFLILVGPSGCGKSTLLNIIAGLDEPTEGEIRIADKNVVGMPPRDRDIAMVFQSYALYPTLSVADNIGFALEMRKMPKPERKKRIDEVAAMLQITHLLDRRPSQLSGGQRQRVAMGRAIVREPKLFLFDEPLSNLDAKLRVDMRTEIKRLHQRLGTTIVYVTHDQIEAMTLATRIAVMKDGIVQHFGPPQEVYDRPANTYVARFVGSPAMNIISAVLHVGTDGQAEATVSLPSGEARITGIPLSAATLKGYHGQKVLLGIRPEHFSLATEGLDAHIDVVEPTVPDTLAVFTMGGTEVIARLEPFAAAAGDRLRLAVKEEKVVVFDAVTESRLD